MVNRKGNNTKEFHEVGHRRVPDKPPQTRVVPARAEKKKKKKGVMPGSAYTVIVENLCM